MNEETKGPEAPTSEKPPISQEELDRILEAHRKWVESGGWEGERDDLERANFQEANLSDFLGTANLRGANLSEARGLTQEQLKYACGDEKTKLPPDMSIPPCPQEKKEQKEEEKK